MRMMMMNVYLNTNIINTLFFKSVLHKNNKKAIK